MGVYDSLHVKFECPRCKYKIEDNAQTKSLDCTMETYELGDKIPDDISTGMLFAGSYCTKCEQAIYIGVEITKGKLAKEISKFVFKNELPKEIEEWCNSAVCSYLGDFKREDAQEPREEAKNKIERMVQGWNLQ